MLVHVKTPRTDLQIEGDGAEAVLQVLRAAYPDLTVEEDEEYVNVRETEWYHKTRAEMTPGFALRAYRENKGMTLRALEALTGISHSNLSAYEHDRRPIGAATAKKLADALGCRIEPLLGRF